jgi:hypothetical protein
VNYYPDTLRTILVYIEALDAADKRVAEEIKADGLPYLEKIPLKDSEGSDYGHLIDEIGGSWSWQVPATHDRGRS